MTDLVEQDGRYHIRFDYREMSFHEDLRLPVTPANLPMAEDLRRRIAEALASGTFRMQRFFPTHPLAAMLDGQVPSAPVTTFGDFARQWLKERRVEWRPSYAETMEVNLRRFLLPRFGEMDVGEIDKTRIMEFRLELAECDGQKEGTRLSAARINKVMQALRMILDDAADRMELRSPWRNIRSLREKVPDIHPLSLAEIARFLDNVRPDYRAYFELRFLTGLRSSEVNALLGKDIMLDEAAIEVRRALMNGRFVDLKTPSSRRRVDLSGRAVDLLDRHLSEKAIGRDDLLFTGIRGAPLNNAWMTNHLWKPALRASLLAERRPYQTRHTAATLWLSAGENPEWVARQLGHATTEMLFRTYSRYLPNARGRDGAAFERMLEAITPGAAARAA